jgi:hypothetical protein
MSGNPVLYIAAFWCATAFIVAFCAVVALYRLGDIAKRANEACDLLYELVQIQRRTLWANSPKTRAPAERMPTLNELNGEDHHHG